MSAAGPLLTMRGVRKAFGAARALDGVDLDAHAGEVHALIGENGAGKSTLMKVLSGALRPDAGTLTLGAEPFAPSSPRAARLQGIAMIYQELAIAPHLSVQANIMLGRERGAFGLLDRGAQRKLAREALAQLGHGDIDPDTIAGELPLARQQLVEVARALVSEARVIVFDEPTAVLSEADAARLFQVIERLKTRGLAVIYISHFLEEVQRLADRYTVLRDGKTVGSGMMRETSLDAIVALMIGRTLKEMFPRVPHEPRGVVLEVAGLAGDILPRNASFELRAGEIVGIAGLVGAGRSELLRALYGLEPVRAGRVRIARVGGSASKRESASCSPRRRIEQGAGFLSEDRKGEGLALTRSIEENLTLSRLGPHARWGWLGVRRRRRAAARWIDELRIASRGPAQQVGELSGGNQQKVALGRLLHQEADILWLDEPTRGVDVGSKVEIYRLMGELAAQGKAVLVVSSYLPELLGVCDRIGVMRRGELTEFRPASAWTEHEIMAVATGA